MERSCSPSDPYPICEADWEGAIEPFESSSYALGGKRGPSAAEGMIQ